jgi:hypothetical protein
MNSRREIGGGEAQFCGRSRKTRKPQAPKSSLALIRGTDPRGDLCMNLHATVATKADDDSLHRSEALELG